MADPDYSDDLGGEPDPYYSDDDDNDIDEADFLANNPALKQVQEAYKRQLLRQKTQAEEELRDKV